MQHILYALTCAELLTLKEHALIRRQIWDAIVDGTIYSCPSLLSSFYAMFFADLKKYKFTYHFAFPALHSSPPWKLAESDQGAQIRLKPKESELLYEAVQTWEYSIDPRQHAFFIAKRDRSFVEQPPQDHQVPATEDSHELQSSETTAAAALGFRWSVASLSAYEQGFFDSVPAEDCYICFADPSTYPANPGWPLRNLLVLAKHRWQLHDIQVLCYRDKHNTREHPNSLILHLTSSTDDQQPKPAFEADLKTGSMPKATGWERSPAGKLTSMTTDLSAYLDPTKLADQAVDLNLKLMKWRIAPSLDLTTIQSTRCLLLGAGTLGSYVARNLLGWGVRHITFVDNGRVSYSNPVRQPLFRFEDCAQGGRAKAERAAEALREIYPGVKSVGVTLSVPMAGHPIVSGDGEAKVEADYEHLRTLIDAHDIVFLLMDTRESRWLPTLMCKSLRKTAINAALGFDTYVVMRHGNDLPRHTSTPSASTAAALQTSAPAATRDTGPEQEGMEGETLGCYFCNDVVAPADSVKDQTLDQQCTVTRPGIAAITAALAVELAVSILQHPLRSRAPAPASRSAERDTVRSSEGEDTQHPLGLVPHSIRGFLGSWDNVLTRGPAYGCCSACSEGVVGLYERDGWAFVKRAVNEPGWIEEVSGLKEVQRRAEEAAQALEDEEEEEDVWDDEGEGELL